MVNLFEFIINIIQESIILMFLTLYFGCRFSAPKKYLGYIAGVVVNVACITYFNTIYIYEGVLGLIFILLYFLYSIIFLKGDVFNKLFMSAFINCIVYFLGLFTILCFSILLPESHDSLYNMFTLTRERVLLTVTVQILLITACALLLRFKPKSNLKKRSIAALIIMPVAVELSMIGFADIFIENNSLSFELLLVSTCIMIACISIYYAYIKISDVVAVEAEYAVLQQRYEYDKRRTGEIEEMYSNTCAMRHDLINHFTTVSKIGGFIMNFDFKKWIKAAGIRAIKTVAQTAVATIGTSAVIGDVNWVMVASASVLAGILSLLTSVAGLPELEE